MRYRYKYAAKLYEGEKISRKSKKYFLGKRLGKSKLQKLLDSVEIIESATNMYHGPIIKPYEFCPFCGSTGTRGTGNLTVYPEHWEYFHCVRCNKVVGYIDNSAYVSALECKEFGYDPIF